MRIDIWSDVVCPWCYVGKRNLEAALASLEAKGVVPEVEISFRAFELDPSAPPTTSRSMAEILSAKYGVSLEKAEEMNAQMTKVAAGVGLEYHLDRLAPGNSFDAHRLAKMAEAAGLGEAASERLFAAYFTEGVAIGDRTELCRLGAEIGLDASAVAAMLESDGFADDVRADEALAREAGFSGVPTYVLDGQFAIPGAQPAETLERLIAKMLEKGSLEGA